MANFRLQGGQSVLLWLNQLPSQSGQIISCLNSEPTPLILVDMDADDPWNWSVDRVVQELCTPTRSWQPRGAMTAIPASVGLEAKIRDQEIDGYALLCDVNEREINALGITKIGWKSFIRTAIEVLRFNSAQYQKYVLQYRPNLVSSHHSASLADFEYQPRLDVFDRRLSSGQPVRSDHIPPTPPEQPQHYPQVQNCSLGVESLEIRQGGQVPITPIDNVSAQSDLDMPDDFGSKRRKLDLTNTAYNLEVDNEDEGAYHIYQPEIPQPESSIPTPTPEPVTIPASEINGKKRKRVAPTLITSEIDLSRDRNIPTAADNVVHNDPRNVEPGVPFFGDDGRKRLVPLRLPDAPSDTPYDYQALLQRPGAREAQALGAGGDSSQNADQNIWKKAKRKESIQIESQAVGYLGKKKMRVDDIFYDGTPVGEDLSLSEDPIDFFEPAKPIASGRRIYVYRVMKRYLQAERQVFLRNGKTFSAVLPYHTKLIPKHQKPSFTLLYAAEDGQIHARREELQFYPEINPEISLQKLITDIDGKRVTFELSDPGMLNTLSFSDNWDPDCLMKYDHAEGGDEVLPVYGESDEENEYDLETWREMEEEQGILDKPLKLLQRQQLTAEEVQDAIDEGVAELVRKWNKEKLPLRQRKALKIWRRHRLKRLRYERIQRGHQEVSHLTQRIANLRKGISDELWTTKIQVHKQTRMLEPSIMDREDWTWEISLLESNEQPEKPLPRIDRSETVFKKSCLRRDDGEEGESIESHSDASSSDGDLDDFIVSDVLSTETDKELNLADGEDEDEDEVTSSDESLPGGPLSKLTVRKLILKHSPRPAKSDIDELMADASDGSSNSVLSTPVKNEERILTKPPATGPASVPEMIDLTMLSSDDAINLITPKKRKPWFKLINHNSPISISDTEGPPDPNNLPPLDDPIAIGKFPYQDWTNITDRERLLIAVLRWMLESLRAPIFAIFSLSEEQLWGSMLEVMDAVFAGLNSAKGVDDTTFETLIHVVSLFAIYHNCKYYPYREKPSKGQIADLRAERFGRFPQFYRFCRRAEGFFETFFDGKLSPQQSSSKKEPEPDQGGGDDEDEDPQSAVKRRRKAINTTDEDDPDQVTPHKVKRKKKVYEDAQARNMREQDRQRIAQQEERRKKLQSALAKSGDLVDQSDIIINDSKLDHEGFIYVNSKIARRIKKHQVEGVRFMWNQIVTGESRLQGCLLAHTMGLGKTMQVITLLVAIAEASMSVDESISSQIPPTLRVSKTLVLCPPGLIDNWMDEFLTWTPEDVLGEFRKVDGAIRPLDRLSTIDDWYNDGGVLILGYEMFRNIVNNKKPKNRDAAPLDDDTHARVLQQLTEGPNIIIADEAHKMKNAAAAITTAASQFRSKSRIALTGSPLANNVEEYHTMIEWVAPNYLGPIVEFRAKYVEPIQAGLWHDSSPYERRQSLKKLGVLKEDLSPKVHRADMSVLKNDLPPKKEFVITVPLTEIQRKAYSLYVQSMISSTSATRTKSGEVTQTTIWHWLAILSLLCNHPDCFWAKLNERKEDARKGAPSDTPVSRDATDDEEVGFDLNAPVWKAGVSEHLIRDEHALFEKEAPDMKSIELSYKVKVLCQILDASKTVGDKVLVFSQSIPTLNFLQDLCSKQHRKYARLDGKTTISKRQSLTKAFNTGNTELYLISTTAGGLGLNLFGANRVVIFDFKFNPIMEEQAVGRAYRIGQKKDVFVYRFVAGGTFEDSVHNKAVFKKQLASRVIDKKNPVAWATRKLGDFLFEPKSVEQKDLSEFKGMDPKVLDKILASQSQNSTIRAIVQSDTFERDDDDHLTAEEQNEVKQLLSDEQLKRSNPKAYSDLMVKRNLQQLMASGFHPGTGAQRTSPHQVNIQHPPPASSIVAQPFASGAILPPPTPKSSMNSPHFYATQSLPARPLWVNHPQSVPIQPPSSLPAAAPSISTEPPASSISNPAQRTPRGLSPILGANTRKRSDTPDSPPKRPGFASNDGSHDDKKVGISDHPSYTTLQRPTVITTRVNERSVRGSGPPEQPVPRVRCLFREDLQNQLQSQGLNDASHIDDLIVRCTPEESLSSRPLIREASSPLNAPTSPQFSSSENQQRGYTNALKSFLGGLVPTRR